MENFFLPALLTERFSEVCKHYLFGFRVLSRSARPLIFLN